MNTLIVYDSVLGKTRQIAQVMADALRILRIAARLMPVDRAGYGDIEKAQLTILGCPNPHVTRCPAVTSFLDHAPYGLFYNRPIAVFDNRCRMPRWLIGSPAQSVGNQLQWKGAWLVVPPESFFINARNNNFEDGELARAEQWAQRVARRVEAFTDRILYMSAH